MSRRRKQNIIGQSFIAHSREMRESPAWRSLPDNARRILDRLELEHMRHGGAENGKLPCTYSDFAAAGVRRASVALALRQCEALGFVECTRRGWCSASEFRNPSLYRLTYVYGCGQSTPRTDEWKRIKSDEVALDALGTAVHPASKHTDEDATTGQIVESRLVSASEPVDAPARLMKSALVAR